MRRTRIRIDQVLSCTEWNGQFPEPRDKGLRDRGCQDRYVTGARKMDHGPVLGDYGVDEVQIAGNAAQVVQDAADHQDTMTLRRRPSVTAASTDAFGRLPRENVSS